MKFVTYLDILLEKKKFMLKKKFYTLCYHFSIDKKLINKLWKEIQINYSDNTRHYHTFEHLKHIYEEFESLKINKSIEFAIFYHDIIYDVRKKTNEEKSALFAKKRLKQLHVPLKIIIEVIKLIEETNKYQTDSIEYSLFLDADLAILGSDEIAYEIYLQQIRKEFSIYDEKTYNKGRKSLLKKFLEKEKIYHTLHFSEK